MRKREVFWGGGAKNGGEEGPSRRVFWWRGRGAALDGAGERCLVSAFKLRKCRSYGKFNIYGLFFCRSGAVRSIHIKPRAAFLSCSAVSAYILLDMLDIDAR